MKLYEQIDCGRQRKTKRHAFVIISLHLCLRFAVFNRSLPYIQVFNGMYSILDENIYILRSTSVTETSILDVYTLIVNRRSSQYTTIKLISYYYQGIILRMCIVTQFEWIELAQSSFRKTQAKAYAS